MKRCHHAINCSKYATPHRPLFYLFLKQEAPNNSSAVSVFYHSKDETRNSKGLLGRIIEDRNFTGERETGERGETEEKKGTVVK